MEGMAMSDTREFETIKVVVDGTVGRLTLNRPERLNAIGATMLRELEEAARWFDTHHDLRVVIVSGAGTRSLLVPISKIRRWGKALQHRAGRGWPDAKVANWDCALLTRSRTCTR
jgi:hypothetical protein